MHLILESVANCCLYFWVYYYIAGTYESLRRNDSGSPLITFLLLLRPKLMLHPMVKDFRKKVQNCSSVKKISSPFFGIGIWFCIHVLCFFVPSDIALPGKLFLTFAIGCCKADYSLLGNKARLVLGYSSSQWKLFYLTSAGKFALNT